jgi:hypothetical protein
VGELRRQPVHAVLHQRTDLSQLLPDLRHRFLEQEGVGWISIGSDMIVQEA